MTTYELRMPSSYALMDNDEMEYLEGGANGWWNKRSTVAAAIDIALTCITLGKSLASQGAIKKLLKSQKGAITKKLKSKVIKMFGSKAGAYVGAAVSVAFTLCGTSLGGVLAWGIDRVDCRKNNGYCFG